MSLRIIERIKGLRVSVVLIFLTIGAAAVLNAVTDNQTGTWLIAVTALWTSVTTAFGNHRFSGTSFKYTAYLHLSDGSHIIMSSDDKDGLATSVTRVQRDLGIYDPMAAEKARENG